ncbi:MAG: M14 family metallopeptidase, partial [Spirosomaceae bacterium]|nr:M14 family metallopeptidase [Spirosomataceae bacterium]
MGYPFGSWHTRYDKMVAYLKELDRLSDRVSVETMGYTNENREQVLVTFAKPSNMVRIEEIRKEHLKLTNPLEKAPDINDMPVVVWLGHNVHGNEPSGGESSLLSAYYIAAVEDEEVTKWLDNAIILMEPVINPDGRDRHTHWANMHRGTPPVSDSQDREHNEAWPGGRTNHYWFDLNRDWFLATQIESQNRLKAYHKWLPNVVTDFHEMGTNATFFFEPTKENAENPLVPKAVYRDLNSFFAKYFEQSLNGIGSLYYTKESYDNLYPGYGSSYPDIQGGLGLLFEQASSRGHVQESQNGDLEFKFTIRNQFVNALATIRASVDGREMLLKHQRSFFEEVSKQGKKSGLEAYVVGDAADHSRNQAFWKTLLHHNIEFYHLQNDVKLSDITFNKGNAVVIPSNQPQYLMLRSIFDTPKTFADSLFYDASAWNLALAYNLPFVETKSKVAQGQRITIQDTETKKQTIEKSSYAYLINYSDYFAPKALYHLLKNEVFVKVSS